MNEESYKSEISNPLSGALSVRARQAKCRVAAGVTPDKTSIRVGVLFNGHETSVVLTKENAITFAGHILNLIGGLK
jgi:hypothetical protein